ncbi:hypothetical protein N9153_00665 [Planctomicrobium sp.]|nr:hypothetical protein [Planctomicrobium sp.]MDB4439412.1 hypothetical protein [Planctomicrobium sp.]
MRAIHSFRRSQFFAIDSQQIVSGMPPLLSTIAIVGRDRSFFLRNGIRAMHA